MAKERKLKQMVYFTGLKNQKKGHTHQTKLNLYLDDGEKMRCFNCHKILDSDKPIIDDLIDLKFPVFCSGSCSLKFPPSYSPEFETRIKEMKKFI